jgi:hypothetical protein
MDESSSTEEALSRRSASPTSQSGNLAANYKPSAGGQQLLQDHSSSCIGRLSYLSAMSDDTTRFSCEAAAFPNSMQGEPAASSSSPFQSPADSSLLFRSPECEKAYRELLASTSAQFPARLRSQVAARSDNYTRWLALKNETTTTTSHEHFNALHNAAAMLQQAPNLSRFGCEVQNPVLAAQPLAEVSYMLGSSDAAPSRQQQATSAAHGANCKLDRIGTSFGYSLGLHDNSSALNYRSFSAPLTVRSVERTQAGMSLVAHPIFSSGLSSPSSETLAFSNGGKGAQTGENTQFPAGDSLRHGLTTPFPLHFGTPLCGPG